MKQMKIDQQDADIIINVGGSFHNEGKIIANEVYLNINGEELHNIVLQDQNTLKAQFSIDYLKNLKKNFEQKIIIDRSVYNEVEQIFENSSELSIIGPPGAGKSCLLFELSKKYQEAIYINIKNKSIKTVVLHLINKIRMKNGQQLINAVDIDSSLEILQDLLVSSKMTFFIDECEEAFDTLDRILLLNKFENKFLYASQSIQEFLSCNIETFQLDKFSLEEAKQFLSDEKIKLEFTKFNELYEASHGNPLYLFYYSHFTIDPLPKDLLKYHQAIWGRLSSKDKECLIFIALSYLPISILTVNSLLKFDSIQETTDYINKLRLISISEETGLSIFHPSFKEFILNELKKSSTLKTYQIRLGEFFIEEREFVQATYLLLDHRPLALENFGFEVLPDLVNRGDFELANRLIEILLNKKRSRYITGYLKYNMYGNLRILNKTEEANKALDEALKLLKSVKDRRFYLMALMNKAVDYVEKGEKQLGLELVDLIMEDNLCSDGLFKAQLLVTLSKIYIDLHQYRKSAVAAKTAYDIFAAQKHYYGLISSLGNLAAALGSLEIDSPAKLYSLKLLDQPLDEVNYAIKLVALNSMTSLSRKSKDYVNAKKYGHEAVYLCQHHKLESKAVLNLVNYGNVIRDFGEIHEAILIYEEALTLSLKLDLFKEQSRIYWILSSIYEGLGDKIKSVEFINNSIRIAEKIRYDYGIAHAYEEKAALLLERNDVENAGKDYEKAFNVFLSMDDMKDETRHCLTKALICYAKSKNQILFISLVNLSLDSFDDKTFIDISGLINNDLNNFDICKYIYDLTERSIKSLQSRNLITSYINYLKFCKENPKKFKTNFLKLLVLMAENINSNDLIKSNLAILLEQSGELLNYNDVTDLINILNQKLEGFFARQTRDEIIFIVRLDGNFKFEFACIKNELINLKLIINFILFIFSIPECLCLKKERKEEICKINFIKYSNFISIAKFKKTISFEGDFQTVSLERVDFSVPIYMIVNDYYESFANLVEDMNNKCNIAFIRSLLNSIIEHFYHLDNKRSNKYLTQIIPKIAYLYDYTSTMTDSDTKEDFQVDLTVLDIALKEFQNGRN
jgi:tetratricopeptide (TPR) repeat protein/ABC-type branched-subunit amino acid transport system ATPase component